MDLMKLTADGRLYNFHSHTQFCDGRASMEQFAQAAVAAGFAHYGFSPHSPVPIDSPCNMSMGDVPVYLAEVERLQHKYGATATRFYASMEIDYLGPDWGPSTKIFQELPLDYRIGSVHFIPSDSGMIDVDGSFANFKLKMERYFANDIRHVVETYYRQSSQMISEGGFDIIGHFDKIGHNAGHFREGIELEGWYVRLVDDLIEQIAAAGIIAEINTKAWAGHHRMFPNSRLMRRVADAGIPLVVNSDAHYPELIDASRAEAFEMLDNEGIHLPGSCHTPDAHPGESDVSA